jgi:hypothetical protein
MRIMRTPLIISFLFLACTLHSGIINVSEYGIVPGKDVTLEVNALIRSLPGEEPVTLYFPAGHYDFYPDNAVEVYRTVANHDNGLKRMAFALFGHRNLTIEGNGSVFMFHGRMVPFTLEGVANVSLKNLVIDFIRPFHAELKVVELDEAARAIVVETDPAHYPYTVSGGSVYFDRLGQRDALAGQNIIFDPATRAPIYQAHEYRMNNQAMTVAVVGEGRLRLTNAFNTLPPLGSVLIVYGTNPTSRLVHAIQITDSSDILIENVTVRAAGGMGLIVERTENVKLDRMQVTSAPNRLVSTRADATHFIGCKGRIEVVNCVFEHMLDDGINVHGAYVPVVKHLSGTTFLCEISHFQQWGLTFAEPGDKVAILSRKTVLPFFETTVSSIRKLNEQRFLITLEALPPELPDVPLSLENLTWNPDLVMRNNIIRENRARSVLVTTKGTVIIENNYFASQMHGILVEGDNDYWYESGAVQDVVIRNNTFENIGFGAPNGYPLFAAPKLTRDQVTGAGHYHRNIRFTDNVIRSFNGNMVAAKSVEGLLVANNRVELAADYPQVTPTAAVRLEYCRTVDIRDNTAVGFELSLAVEATADCDGIQLTGNTGLNGAKGGR